MNTVRSNAGSISRQLRGPQQVQDYRGTVLSAIGQTCDVKLSNGTVLRSVNLVGHVTKGQDVDVGLAVGRPIVYGGSLAAVRGNTTIIGGVASGGSSGGGGSTTLTAHALNDTAVHTGTLSDAQAPQFLKTDGTRPLTGDLAVGAGIKIDGYDISATFITMAGQISTLFDSINATIHADYLVLSPQAGLDNERVLSLTNIGPATAALTAQDNGANNTYQLRFTSTSYPGAQAGVLSTDATGGVGVQRLGIGGANDSSMALKSVANLPSGLAGQLMVGTVSVVDSQFYVVSTVRSQFRVGYNLNNYMEYTVSSTGSATIFATGDVPQDAHIYLATAGGVSVGAGAPQARLHLMSSSLPVLRAGRDAVTYMQIDVSPSGISTLSASAAIPANGHIVLAPGGNVGVNTGASVPGAKVEIRSGTGAQLLLSYDTAANMSTTVNSGGNVEVLTYGSDYTLNLQPVGGLAGQKFLLPKFGYDINIGRLDRVFASIHGAELYVQTMVAFETAAVAGGHLMVVPSSPLKEDFSGGSSGSTTVPLVINHVASASGVVATADANWYPTLPGGWVAGDVILIALETSAAVTATAPLGWTQMPTNIPVAWGSRQLNVFYRVLQVSDTGPYGFSLSAAAQGVWTSTVYHNVNTTGPLAGSNAQANAVSDLNMTAPTITTTADASMVVMIGANNNGAVVTAPAGMTKRVEVFEGNSFNRLVVFDKLQAVAGSTGSIVATNGGAATSGVLLVALRPATTTVGGTAATVMKVKHNSFNVGDSVLMQARGKVEWMNVISAPTGSADSYTMTVSRNVDGTGANDWIAGDVVINTGQVGQGWVENYAWWSSKGNPVEYIYTLNGSTWSANRSLEPSWTLFGATSPAPGSVTYYGMGGGKWSNINHYIIDCLNTGFTGVIEFWNGSAWTALTGATSTAYNNTTGVATALTVGNLPASPSTIVVAWNALTQTNWARSVVNGVDAYWVRWRVATNASGYAKQGLQRVVRAQAQFGPTVVGYVRNSNVFNDYDARFAVGNLHGHYDYGKLTYGFAAGKYATGQTWVAADADNGFRIMRGTAKLGTWDNTGTIQLWSATTGLPMIQLNADGSGFVSGGAISWDTAGNATVKGSVQVGELSSLENILYNSTFKAHNGVEPDGWHLYNNNPGSTATASIIDAGLGVDGGAFFRVTLGVANNGTKGVYADTTTFKKPMRAFATYMISFYAKSSAARAFGCALMWNINPATTNTFNNPTLSTTWQRYAFKVTWGATADPNIFVSAANVAGWTGSVDFDHFQVEETGLLTYWKPSNDELLPGTVKANHISVSSLSAIKADLGIIYAGQFRLGNQDSLTYNAATFTGLRMVQASPTTYRFEGVSAGSVQAYFDTDGKVKAGGGNVTLDSSGVSIATGSSYQVQSALKFTFSGAVISNVSSWRTTGSNVNVMDLGVVPTGSFESSLNMYAQAGSTVQADASMTALNATYSATFTARAYATYAEAIIYGGDIGLVPGSGRRVEISELSLVPSFSVTLTGPWAINTYITAFNAGTLHAGTYLIRVTFNGNNATPWSAVGSGIITILSQTNAATAYDQAITLATASHTAVGLTLGAQAFTGIGHITSGLRIFTNLAWGAGSTAIVEMFKLVW